MDGYNLKRRNKLKKYLLFLLLPNFAFAEILDCKVEEVSRLYKDGTLGKHDLFEPFMGMDAQKLFMMCTMICSQNPEMCDLCKKLCKCVCDGDMEGCCDCLDQICACAKCCDVCNICCGC